MSHGGKVIGYGEGGDVSLNDIKKIGAILAAVAGVFALLFKKFKDGKAKKASAKAGAAPKEATETEAG